MAGTLDFHASGAFKSKDDPSRGNALVSSHIFQDSFPALGTHNAIGGSATVHAQQAKAVHGSLPNWECVMVAPTEHPTQTLADLRGVSAIGFRFPGSAARTHDEWFERPNREMVASILEDISRRTDPLYSHMPISGAIASMVQQSQGNPHIYLGHAWEYLSAQYFPERGIKNLRLLTEYEMISKADVIVTNTVWEAKTIAEMYSKLPGEKELRGILDKVGVQGPALKFISDLILRDSGPLLGRDEIFAKCVANPLGVDQELFNPERRALLREAHRSEFLRERRWSEDSILIGSVGRIHPQKDPITSLEVFESVFERLGRPNNLKLVLAGPYSTDERGSATGYYRQVLEALDSEFHAIKAHVFFPGEVAADSMNAILDIRLDTSRFETFGLSIVEALSSGLPSVARTNPVYEELYEGQKVIIQDSVEAISESLVRLVKDPQAREEYGLECRKAGSQFTWENSVRLLEKNVLAKYKV